ncbi:SusC/RagA family TonB-linked outer membrane protein [Dyadobacter subterraneus]|uniref:SusC/RagA family TonB-linked outer membrane protein n=1 Tax=Dyadobacter subterraneus TaxID=2773304 RepID=A0ABR9W6J2_9BACT|nr:SusC/RagA family TonB-linked outer membrane protein [Dyadobacter subterraneus]MBE9461085.1 SusC/RagA family TonB-linked outer membrane protein [Dyadobacter subterraneus]
MLKELRPWLLTLLAVALFTVPIFAQDVTVTGTILDENGAGLPGANILLKGTTRGTNSDGEGKFSLSIPSAGGTFIISSVGYLPKELNVSSSTTNVNVGLEPDVRSLNEVVVTALGIERSAKSLTYATQQIAGKQLTDNRDANFVNTLSGKVAGLVVSQGAAGPGSAARVILRGNRSITGNNNALFVVDGVPIDNSLLGQVSSDFGGSNSSDGASNINPDDIESMNVLKGAAASALYGSRAANGVIMITTKKGKAGQISTNINSGVTMESPFLLPKLQNEYGQGSAGVAGTGASSWGPKTTTYPNNISDFFRHGVSTNNSIGISGGTDKIQTYTSYTNNYNQGIVPTNNLMRHTFNMRISSQVTSKLSVDAKITYVNQKIDNKQLTGEASNVMQLYKIPRSVDLDTYRNYEGSDGYPTYWTTSSIYTNPFWNIYKNTGQEKRNRITALGSAKYQLTNWLSVQGRISYDRYDDVVTNRTANNSLGGLPGGSYSDYQNNVLERNLDVLLSGNNKLGKDFLLSYNLGAGQTHREYSQIGGNAGGLTVPNRFDLSFARTLTKIADYSERELQYVFGTASLSYKDFITIDASARNDWSSTLPKPYSYFYSSFSGNVILSEALKMPQWISFAKVRGSWAQVGADTDPYRLNQNYTFYQGGNGGGYISRDNTQPATNLKPEISSSTEFGADLRFFNGRLGIDATYYISNTVNQLLSLGKAPASGFLSQYINAGKIRNEGFEITLTGKPIKNGKLNWDITLNMARNVNTIIKLDPNIKSAFLSGGYGRTASPIVKEGGSYGDLVGYKWLRDAQGRFVVTAPDADGKNGGKPVSTATQDEKVGNFNPKLTAGLNNSFSYGNFVASFLIDARIGGQMTSGSQAILANDGNADYTTNFRDGGWIIPAVTTTGETNTTPINAETFWTTASGGRYSWAEFFTYSTTNVRLREITVGYNIPFGEKFFFKNARVSFVARNLFFIYRGYATLDIPGIAKRKLPFDPDVTLGSGNYQGVEYGTMPSTRSIGLNLKLSF